MSVVDFEMKRKELEKSDKILIDDLIHMHADMCTGIDLTKVIYSDVNSVSELEKYEKILAVTIERLKQLSPHLN